MIEDCKKIRGLMIDYLNQNLIQKERAIVILHLSKCESCRKEIADMIILQKQISLSEIEVPQDLKDSAFDKIPKQEKGIEGIIVSKSPFMAIDIIGYALSPIKKTIKLVLQEI
jgi:hypothetical protein